MCGQQFWLGPQRAWLPVTLWIDTTTVNVSHEEIVLALSADDPLITHARPRLTDLAERPLVHYDSANGLAGRVDRICAAAGSAPRGTAIDDPTALDLLPLKPKSISWHWEFMFTRPLFSLEDTAQHRLLNEVAELIESGAIRTTITARLQPLNAATVLEAHRLVETGSTIGKVVVSAR